MKTEFYNEAYSTLVVHANASESERGQFIIAHTMDEPCDEWRFCGDLGFGGKYRRKSNTVDCYPEDATDERRAIIKQTNEALASIPALATTP